MKKKLLTVVTIAVLLGAFYFVIHESDIDDRLSNWYYELTLSGEMEKRSIQLGVYTAVKQRVEIGCVSSNLSGITYNPDSKTLFAITNGPEMVLELSTDGDCLRSIPLAGFVDTEAIVYLGKGEYAIVEERSSTVSIIRIKPDTQRVGKRAVLRSIAFEIDNKANKGFEGIAYNPDEESLYVVTERSPMILFRFDGLADHSRDHFDVRVSRHKKVILRKGIMHDYSGLHFDARSGNLLCLSHEAMLVAEVSLEGDIVGFMELEKGFSSLLADVLQAEGITMDEERRIYVVGEPNHFYVFEPEQES